MKSASQCLNFVADCNYTMLRKNGVLLKFLYKWTFCYNSLTNTINLLRVFLQFHQHVNKIRPDHVVHLSVPHRVAYQIYEELVNVLHLQEVADHFVHRRHELHDSLANSLLRAGRTDPFPHFSKLAVLVFEGVRADAEHAATDHVDREFCGQIAALYHRFVHRYFVQMSFQIFRALHHQREHLLQLAGCEYRRQFHSQWPPSLGFQQKEMLRQRVCLRETFLC